MNETYLWHHRALNVSLFQAFHSIHAYPRHSHEYYVIAVVDSGLQSFSCDGTKYQTPVDGLIFLNPGAVHTGEPADEHGFGYRAFYPTLEHMQRITAELGWRDVPYFSRPRADDPQMMGWIRALWTALQADENLLEGETRFLLTLVELMKRFGGQKSNYEKRGFERGGVRQVRAYIHEHYAEPISLSQLAELVNFSRYYLLHTFRDEMGMPPHLYLESVRIQQAQRLLMDGEALAQVAHQVGFASQSHFTQRFRQIIGVTPGVYARQIKQGV